MADIDALLQPVTVANEAQLFMERWSQVLDGVELPRLVEFARRATNLRSHAQSVTALNGLLTVIAEIRRTGKDLETGTVKTVPEARSALVSPAR